MHNAEFAILKGSVENVLAKLTLVDFCIDDSEHEEIDIFIYNDLMSHLFI